MRHHHLKLRAFTLPCLMIAALHAPSALAQVTYSFAGEPFTYADPPYSVGDRVLGSIDLAEALPPFMPPTDITSLLLDFTFGDGVQTRIPANTNVCRFEVATDGAGIPSHWTIALRQ